MDWIDPLILARRIPTAEKCFALLYSGLKTNFTGRYSYLALRAKDEIISDNFPELPNGKWFGYFGYGLKNRLEKLPEDNPGIINLPDCWLINYETIIIFDHEEKKIEILGNTPDFSSSSAPMNSAALHNLKSNMAKPEYLKKVQAIKERIAAGDVYQANLTRKFYGKFESAPSPIAIFENLCHASPAPYSCLMKLGENYIISSSPELFIKIDKNGNVESRPIKGTVAISDKKSDLEKSEKDRTENLMIVDLVRNDLSRCCQPGSVAVKSLFDVTSYTALHHMSSTITGKKKPEIGVMQTVKDCFPPGSMTGAPKIKAMEICSGLEEMARGVYSGALGWISNEEAELSVVIRTIIIKGKEFEFQVGGAITHDSDPEAEWQETLLKAEGIRKTLGIKNLI